MANDLTIIYYTANRLNPKFFENTWNALMTAKSDIPMVVVSQVPMPVENNIVLNFVPSHLNIYRQALIGAKKATTKYIALCEDDILYSYDHFKFRPTSGKFAYNMCLWGIFTWVKPPLFNYKGRRNLSQLICERELFIEAMEERFAQVTDDDKVNIGKWAEPGKYEKLLGVTERESEEFYSDIPNIMFSHKEALGYLNLGEKKRMGKLRATALPYWGEAEKIIQLYE